MYFSSLLLFLEFLKLSHGYMLWNPNQIEYERFKQAAYEAISAEAKKESLIDLPKQAQQSNSQGELSSLRSLFPIWTFWSPPTIQMPVNLPTTTNPPILSTVKPHNFIFRTPWSSKIAFSTKTKSTKAAKTNKKTKSRKLAIASSRKSKNKQYNPLCFFSALPCGPRRKNVYYVPRKNQNE